METLREELCAARVDNGFSTSYSVSDPGGNYSVTITGGNGVELFSSSQTREDGGKPKIRAALREIIMFIMKPFASHSSLQLNYL